MTQPLCNYCNDSQCDIFNKVEKCPFCFDGKPRGADYPDYALSLSISYYTDAEKNECDEIDEKYPHEEMMWL